MTLSSPLGRGLPKPSATPEEIEALRRKAFLEHDVAMVRLKDVPDPLTRKIIRHEAERQMGLRA